MTLPQSRIKVDSIEGSDGVNPVIVAFGASIPSGASLTASNASFSGIVTATSFSGDGSQLTNVDIIGKQKAIAINYAIG